METTGRAAQVGTQTEHVFTEDFWMSLDLVCNALDNMKARFYVDQRCVSPPPTAPCALVYCAQCESVMVVE